MKTPEEIKRGLKACYSSVECTDCPYIGEDLAGVDCCDLVKVHAKAYIQQLEQDNAQKDERIRQLEREKAELLNMCEQFGQCVICKHTSKALFQSPCCDCWYGDGGDERSYWEWCGVEEDEA